MKRKFIIIIAAIVLIIVAGLFFFIQQGKKLAVEKVDVKNVVVEQTVSGSGEIKSENQANLAFSASGKITSLGAAKGESVKSGQFLAQLYAYPQVQAVQAARDARDIAIRNRDLFIEQNKEDSDTSEYEIQLRTYNEQVSQAEANLKATTGNLANQIIRSPFAGTVVDRAKEVGENATASEIIYTIADLSKLYMEIELDQEDFGYVQIGQKTEITLDAYEDTTFTGTVTALPQYAEQGAGGNQTFLVKIAVDAQEGKNLLLGMTGDARITVAQTDGEVQALDFDVISADEDENPYIWVVTDKNILEKKSIETGLEGDIETEVKTDLSGLTIVIPANTKTELTEGAKVSIAE